jgi:hypothetical protein
VGSAISHIRRTRLNASTPSLANCRAKIWKALVTAWAFDGVSILSVDQDGPRVIKRAQNAPGTEQLLRDLGINSEH